VISLIVGLAAVYAGFSVLASWVQEGIAGALQLRAKNLVAGIEAMVADPKNATLATAVMGKLLSQPSIAATIAPDGRLPSYLSANQFSLAITGLLNTSAAINVTAAEAFGQMANGINGIEDGRLKDALQRIANQAAGDYQSFISGIERWYDDQMDRIAGWYRRSVQFILAAISIVLVAAFNVDTIQLFYQLQAKPLIVDASKLTDDAAGQTYAATLVLQNVKIGWPDAAFCAVSAPPPLSRVNAVAAVTAAPCYGPKSGGEWVWYLLWKVAGFVMTGLAIMLGAPFWFDTLKRFVNVRSAGPPPATSDSSST
jgi:hypothetical protein